MIIIGEKINTSIKAIRPAVEKQNAAAIREVAQKQVEAGAQYIDVNCGTFHFKEPELLQWLVETVQEATDAPLSIDSPNPAAMLAALKAYKGAKPLLNSLTAETERFQQVFPLVKEYNTSVIALCMDDSGMPETADQRVKIADWLINAMVRDGVALEDIYLDPMIRPVSTGTHYGVVALDTIRRVTAGYPGVHTTCGLSNVSYGLPARKLINQTFLISAIAAGLDSAILDPLDTKLMTFVLSAELIQGRDEFCLNYIEAFRDGKLEV